MVVRTESREVPAVVAGERAHASKRIRILYIMDQFRGTGGTERHIEQLVRHLPEERFASRIVVFDLGPNKWIDSIRAKGIEVIHVPVGREYSPLALAKAVELYKIIRQYAPHIVQTFHQKSDTYGALIAKAAGVKHIVSSKRDIGQLKKARHFFANRALRSLFERIIVVADAVGEVVTRREGIAKSRIARIYNGVDATNCRPASKDEARMRRIDLGFAPNDLVVGLVAAFRPEKNHEVFFAGAREAMSSIPNLKMLVVGEGPLLTHFRTRAVEEGYAGSVVFPGDVANVPRYLGAMDIGCLIPGSNEGFSNAVLEMMAAGLPMIVSDVGGNAEAVLHGQNGLVIPPNDSGAFCRALLELYSDPDRRDAMGRRSRQLVEERFTLDRMCKEHEALYASLCS